MFALVCKLLRHHAWYAYEAYSGEWFDVCARCHKARSHVKDKT
jgi:hypothetical protein